MIRVRNLEALQEVQTELANRGRLKDIQDASLILSPSANQSRRDVYTRHVSAFRKQMVPVIDSQQIPIMPCSEKRARKMVESGKATPFWKKGMFCVRLNKEPSSRSLQQIAVGIDPGSKKEGFTVKSEAHTLLNINADAVAWVKDAVETRKNMRRTRRFRKTPYRKNKYNRNRKHNWLAPSTRARWGWKLRICNWLVKLYPITDFIVEDIKAKSNSGGSFSILEVGKNWFYSELRKLGILILKQGWETKNLRDSIGLYKTKDKLAEVFEAHCVDSWALANWLTEGHAKPDNTNLLCISPIKLHRRQLHYLRPTKGGIRKLYGGTRSCGLKRGSLVRHSKYGISYIGGTANGRVSLHSVVDGKRLTQTAKVGDIRFLSYNTWRAHNVNL